MDRILDLLANPLTALFVAVLLGGLAISGRFSPNAALSMFGLAWLIAVVGIHRSSPIQSLHWIPRVLWTALVGSALGITLFYLGQWVRADLRVSPERMKIWPQQPSVFPFRIGNRRDRDLEQKAVLMRFAPALPSIADANFIPPRRPHPVTGQPTMDERIRVLRWDEPDATNVLFLVEYIYAMDSVEYQVVVDTSRLASRTEVTTAEVNPAAYASRAAQVTLPESPNENLLRLFPQRLERLAKSPTATMALVIGDGAWRTAHGSYADLLPIYDRGSLRVHLFRDVDDRLKLDLRTPSFPGGVLSVPLNKLGPGPAWVVMFGWAPTGIVLHAGGVGGNVHLKDQLGTVPGVAPSVPQ